MKKKGILSFFRNPILGVGDRLISLQNYQIKEKFLPELLLSLKRYDFINICSNSCFLVDV